MNEEIKRLSGLMPFVPPGLAFVLAGVGRTRGKQLLAAGRFQTVSIYGARFVYIASIVEFREARERWLKKRELQLLQARTRGSKTVVRS